MYNLLNTIREKINKSILEKNNNLLNDPNYLKLIYNIHILNNKNIDIDRDKLLNNTIILFKLLKI